MRTDAELRRDVEAELAWSPQVKSPHLGVAVKDGIVTVSGHLETYAEKRAVENAVRRIRGVNAFALELDVRLSPEHRRSDTDIATSCETALRWNTSVPRERIRITVEDGQVCLQGEVDWDYQRQGAEKAIRPLMGVRGVDNQLVLNLKPRPEDVQRRIADALTRQARREARRLHVSVEGNTVRLTGQVHSWHERDAALGVAWSAPGVRSVVSEITVE